MISKSASFFALALSNLLAGCTTLPPGSCDHWNHNNNLFFFTTYVSCDHVIKSDDGSFKIGHYHGSLKVAGIYGPEDDVDNLILNPNKK